MKGHGTSFVGVLAFSVLMLAPVYAQGQSGAGKGQGSEQGSQASPRQRTGEPAAPGQGREQSPTGAGTQSGSSNRMAGDSAFVTKAAQGGMAEVKLGELASEKGASAEVKDFGRQMVTDHGKANDELKQLAGSKGITLPRDMGAKHQSEYDRLSKLSGEEFDKAYMQHMVKAHTETVNDFKQESNSGSDSEVKAWAAKTLPTVEHHLQKAKDKGKAKR